MNALISAEIARLSAQAKFNNFDVPVNGAEAVAKCGDKPVQRSFADQMLAKGEEFAIANIDAPNPEEFVAAPLSNGKPELVCMTLAKNPTTSTERAITLFIGTFMKSVKNKDTGATVKASVKLKNGTVLDFSLCITKRECWRLLSNKNFRVAEAIEVPVIKRDFTTKIQYNSTAWVYEFEEI